MSITKYKTDNYPYKVYTALLTQSGGSNPLAVSGDGEYINFGVTYEIVENPDNYDLTIYGAPNNNVGTYFVSNQTIALPYTVSLQLLTNTGAPVATVLENTLDAPVTFSYDDVGSYIISGNFPLNKTVFIVSNIGECPGDNISVRASIDTNSIYLVSNNLSFAGTGSNSNDILTRTPIEIRVYN